MLGLEIANKYLHNIELDIELFRKEKESIVNNPCLARIWDKGIYGNTQCSNISIDNNELCHKHYISSLRMNGNWWLGKINEERPENPIHPISGKHSWKKDKNGNDYHIK